MKKTKKIMAMCSLTLMFLLVGNVNASATGWSMTFPAMGLEKTDWDSSDNCDNNDTSWISLTRIVEGPSYYMKGQAVNSNNESRSGWATILQGSGGETLPSIMMTEGIEYHVRGENHYWETSHRWAYGSFDF